MAKKGKELSNPLFYVAMGDSLTVGIGAILQPGFVKRYKVMTKQTLGREIHHFVFARHGETSEYVLGKLQEPFVKCAIRHAHIITISAGGNDLRKAGKKYFVDQDTHILELSLQAYIRNMKKILQKIAEIKCKKASNKKINDRYIVRLLDLYNPYPTVPLAVRWVKRFNKELRKLENEKVKATHLYDIFKGREKELLFIDQLHPNATGYQEIAVNLVELGYSPLGNLRP